MPTATLGRVENKKSVKARQNGNNKTVVTDTYPGPEADASLPDITSDPDRSESVGTPLPKNAFGKKPDQPEIAQDLTAKDAPKQPKQKKEPPNVILLLGGSLIVANLVAGGTVTSIGTKLLNKPEGVGPQKTKQGQALLMEVLGETGFVILLATLARIFPNLTRPITVFLMGLWLVWIIFQLPDAVSKFKTQGLTGVLGLTGSTPSSSSSVSSISDQSKRTRVNPSDVSSSNTPVRRRTNIGGSYRNEYTPHHNQFIG